MKRICSIVLTLCLMLSALTMLSSCMHTCEFSTEWSKDAASHWHACTGRGCEEIADKANHVWNEGVITTAPTQEADGVKTFTCSVCGQTTTEAVAFTGMSEDEWRVMTHKDAFENVTFTQLATAKATGIEATSKVSIAFTKDAALMKMEIPGQDASSQFISGADEVDEGRDGMLDSMEEMMNFANYDYDKETKTYKSNKKITEMTEGKQVTDVVLTVENGKIASISYSYKQTQNNVEMTMSITITFTDYGTTVAEDPNA